MLQFPALPRRWAWLVVVAAVVNGVNGALTALLPDLLNGPPVMNGSARGTGLIMAIVGTPALLAATWLAARGSWRALLAVLGLLAYLVYNDVLLLFATPFNRLFLLSCAGFTASLFTLIAVLRATDARAVAEEAGDVPARGIAGYIWAIVVLNSLAWLARVVPGVIGGYPPEFLVGTGLTTNPIFAQDLSFWLPGAAIVGWLLWTRRPWGIVLGGAYLVYGLVEAIGVATDQWLGSSADPTSTVATMGGAYLFAVVAVVGIVPLALFFRGRERPAIRLVSGAHRA
jgi:hypothetical protein